LHLIRTGEVYRLYDEDAVKSAKILGIGLNEYAGNRERGFTSYAEFPMNQLDSYLPKLVRAGERVAISDMEAQEKQQAEQETHSGIHR
jgi:DNA primase